MSRTWWWATSATYHRQLRVTNAPPPSSAALQQTCRGKTREMCSIKVRDVSVSYHPGCKSWARFFSPTEQEETMTQIWTLFDFSASDLQEVPQRCSAWLRVQTQLHNKRLSSAPLPRTPVCMYIYVVCLLKGLHVALFFTVYPERSRIQKQVRFCTWECR